MPPAAFAALVANDLVSPGAFDAGLWPALVPWIAAAGVVVVAVKTKSMLWCCVSGIVLYIVLSLI
ncbi:MAG: AzlD domain-containing protein [Collinsella aerofaciens]